MVSLMHPAAGTPIPSPRFSLHEGRAEDVYDRWRTPDIIVSDGAYGVAGFPGDPRTPDELPDWYRAHAAAWSWRASPSTTLCFWNTEIGWALVHPLLAESGWEYVQTILWNKGIRHIAGNVNSETIRQLPVVTEVCAFYRRRLMLPLPDGRHAAARDWLRSEWLRTGLALNRANDACGVASAATRKYLTDDHLWYSPPPAMMARLAAYANEHGRPDGMPYYSLDGREPVTGPAWAALRHPWRHHHGVTNVWFHPPVNGGERYRADAGGTNGPATADGGAERRRRRPGANAVAHPNQKPLELMQRIVAAASREGDTLWEPFGGLCTASAAAVKAGRRAHAAETDPLFARLARARLAEAAA